MPESESYPRIRPAGDQAVLVEFGAAYSKEVSRAVMAFDRMLRTAPAGVSETVPTIRSVLITFDPASIDPERLESWCAEKLAGADWYDSPLIGEGPRWRIPVIYGGGHGPEISEAAAMAGLTENQLIERHASVDLTVLCLGFSPGLAYLAELPEEFAIPRRQAYGRPVPSGSVLIANRQTVLPATPIPTGWRRIGVTPLPTFRPSRSKPFLLSPGDVVRFEPVSESEAAEFRPDTVWDALGDSRT